MSWLDDYRDHLMASRNIVNEAFDETNNIYDSFIRRSHKTAIDTLWKHMTNNDLLLHTENPITFFGLRYRGRINNFTNTGDIREYFHIPFSMRGIVPNYRFSISGQPVLYLGSSILSIERELETNYDSLAIACFLPKYRALKNQRIYPLNNHITETIENSLSTLFDEGFNEMYDNKVFTLSKDSLRSDIYRHILMSLCTFPRKNKEVFAPEYIIPQILTTALLENDYDGIQYPSTRDFSDISGYHKFAKHYMNYSIFVPYTSNSDINDDLLNSYTIIINPNHHTYANNPDDLIQKSYKLIKRIQESIDFNQDYIVPISIHKLYIEYMRSAKYKNEEYFKSKIGQAELYFFDLAMDEISNNLSI